MVFRLWAEKKNAKRVAIALRKGKNHVHGILKNYDSNTGAPLKPHRFGPLRSPTKEEDEELLHYCRHNRNVSLRKAAANLGVSKSVLHARLREAKVYSQKLFVTD